MVAAERHKQIIDALQSHSFLSITALAQWLNVSEMTIRRDVAALSLKGTLLAVRGGVKPLTPALPHAQIIAENSVLLRAALSYLEESRTIFFDSSGLCRQLAQLISWTSKMTVVTNDVVIAHDIMRQTQAQLIFIGGELNRNDNSCYKALTIEMLERLNFELLFLSPESWNENGVWHNDERRQQWYSHLMTASRRKVVLAEGGNYNHGGLFRLYALSEVDMVISNYPAIERLLIGKVDLLKVHPLSKAT